jgi:hypothetical protein
VRTKYGTKNVYLAAVKDCRDLGLQVYADTVFNHKMAADFEIFDAPLHNNFHRASRASGNDVDDVDPTSSHRNWTTDGGHVKSSSGRTAPRSF